MRTDSSHKSSIHIWGAQLLQLQRRPHGTSLSSKLRHLPASRFGTSRLVCWANVTMESMGSCSSVPNLSNTIDSDKVRDSLISVASRWRHVTNQIESGPAGLAYEVIFYHRDESGSLVDLNPKTSYSRTGVMESKIGYSCERKSLQRKGWSRSMRHTKHLLQHYRINVSLPVLYTTFPLAHHADLGICLSAFSRRVDVTARKAWLPVISPIKRVDLGPPGRATRWKVW